MQLLNHEGLLDQYRVHALHKLLLQLKSPCTEPLAPEHARVVHIQFFTACPPKSVSLGSCPHLPPLKTNAKHLQQQLGQQAL